MAAKPRPQAVQPPIPIRPPDMADLARTLGFADELLGQALIDIEAHFATNLKACDNSLADCRKSISAQLDKAIEQGWRAHKDGSQIVRDNLAYLMSEAQQYAAQLGYPGTRLADPSYASPAEHIARQIDSARTGIGDVDVSSWPSNMAVGVRVSDPAVQRALETTGRYKPNFLTLNTGVYALIGEAKPTVQETPAAGVGLSPSGPTLPLEETQPVTYPGTASLSPAAVSLIANIPPSIVSPAQGLFQGIPPSVAVTPAGVPGIAAALRRSAGLGTKSNPWTPATGGGYLWPNVKPGDWVQLPLGLVGQALPCSQMTGSYQFLNPTLCVATDAAEPMPAIALPASLALAHEPIVPPSTPTTPTTPWDCANCPQTPAPCPAPIIQIVPCPGPLSGAGGLTADQLTPNLPVPVDLDQLRAFIFSPDDAEWKAAALNWSGDWLQRLNSFPTAEALDKYVAERMPGATREDN